MAAGVGTTSLGPGSPQPVQYGYRQPSLGKPSVSYEPRAGRIESTVAHGKAGAALSATFQPRPPIHPPGTHGVGDHGAFVDVRA
ncbi:MAG TPA: hypothetical protein VFC93_08550 [Chloroflexota bacterium]|jgi:hypothetical protein|nr:hypothetical protein [Chloroflexota bacterium]